MKQPVLGTLLLVTTSFAQAQTAPMFAAAATYSTGNGSSPYAVVVADVNGDGKPDVLTANQAASTVGVLLGTGTGSFGAVISFSTGSGPSSLAVADVNGDGKLDLLTANSDANTAGVLLGTGTGTFGSMTSYSTGSNSFPYGLAVADVNGDGKLDLLTANYPNSTVGVLLGTGTGGFGPVSTLSIGSGSNQPYGIAVADVNGDSKPDLLTANSGSNTVGVLLGTGTGSFGTMTSYSTGSNSFPHGLAVADVNGDGKLDLLTINNGTATVGVLLGTGTGSFGPVSTFGTGSGSFPYALAVADVNGDHRPDVLTANYNGNAVGVLLNTSTYTPLATATSRVTTVTLYPNPTAHAATLNGVVPNSLIQVYNALGSVVLTTQASGTGVAILALPSGLYLVRAGVAPALRLTVE